MKNKKYSTESTETNIADILDSFDKERSEGLLKAQRFLKMDIGRQENERKRLAKKYGEAHPKVQNINARLAMNEKSSDSLSEEIKRVFVEKK